MSNEFILIAAWKPFHEKSSGLMSDAKVAATAKKATVDLSKWFCDAFTRDVSCFAYNASIADTHNMLVSTSRGLMRFDTSGQTCDKVLAEATRWSHKWRDCYLHIKEDNLLYTSDSQGDGLVLSTPAIKCGASDGGSGDVHLKGVHLSKNSLWLIDSNTALLKIEMQAFAAGVASAERDVSAAVTVIQTGVLCLAFDDATGKLYYIVDESRQVRQSGRTVVQLDKKDYGKVPTAVVAGRRFLVVASQCLAKSVNILQLYSLAGRLVHEKTVSMLTDSNFNSKGFMSLRLIVRCRLHFLLAVSNWNRAGLFMVSSKAIVSVLDNFAAVLDQNTHSFQSVFGGEVLPGYYMDRQFEVVFVGYNTLNVVIVHW
jgi:hypothetical protein